MLKNILVVALLRVHVSLSDEIRRMYISFFNSQVRLLVDIENSLPEFIMKRVQVYSYCEFPNHPKTLKQKVGTKI